MIINQNILAILRTLLKLQEKNYKKFCITRTSTAPTTEFVGKISNRNI